MLTCGCCHGSDVIPILRAPDKSGQAITIGHCRACCALTPDYPGSRHEIIPSQTAYHENWWRDESDDELRCHRDAMLGLFEFHARYMPARERPHLVLDVGAGRCNLLSALVTQGYNALGCEPSTKLVARARQVYGLDESRLVEATAQSFLGDREARNERADAIFLWHVLEHLEDPICILERASRLLREEGALICQGPLLTPEYVFPEHLFFHTESNIAWLAQKAGLKLLLLESRSSERFVSFVLGAPGRAEPSISAVILHDPLLAVGSLYFTYDRALQGLRAKVSFSEPKEKRIQLP